MDKQQWYNTFFIGILGLTIGLGGGFVDELRAQQETGDLYGRVTDNYSEITRVLQSSVGTEEKERLVRQTLQRMYQTDVDRQLNGDPQTESEDPERAKLCFNQGVTITWDGVQQDKWGRNEIHGTEGDDVIRGTDQADLIVGHGGEDIICAGDGDDWVYGDDHRFNASNGRFDLIDGEDGDDTIFGGGGNDWLHGSDGDDGLFGDFDFDHLFGGNDNDFLVGMWGTDVHHGGNGDDNINAQEFDDSPYDESYGDEGYDGCHVDIPEADSLVLTFCEIVIPH